MTERDRIIAEMDGDELLMFLMIGGHVSRHRQPAVRRAMKAIGLEAAEIENEKKSRRAKGLK